MTNVLLICVVAAVILLFSISAGFIVAGWLNVLLSILLLVVGVGSLIWLHNRKQLNKGTGDSNELLQNQVKFYDFLFKIIAIFLALAAILVYKDRQDMKKDYELMKIRLEEQYKSLEKSIAKKADSLIADVSNQLNESLNQAEKNIETLNYATEEAKHSEKTIRIATQTAEKESSRLKGIREDITHWFYTQQQMQGAGPFDVPLIYCARDSLDSKKDDKWYNNHAIDFYNDGEHEKAKRLFITAIELNPRNKQALTNLAHIYFLKDRYDSALIYQIQYISVEPEDAMGYLHKAECLMELGEIKEAYKAMVKSCSLGCEDYSFIVKRFCNRDSIFYNLLPPELK